MSSAIHDHDDQHGGDCADDRVLAVQVGAGALLDRRGDVLHLLVAGRPPEQPARRQGAVDERGCGAAERKYDSPIGEELGQEASRQSIVVVRRDTRADDRALAGKIRGVYRGARRTKRLRSWCPGGTQRPPGRPRSGGAGCSVPAGCSGCGAGPAAAGWPCRRLLPASLRVGHLKLGERVPYRLHLLGTASSASSSGSSARTASIATRVCSRSRRVLRRTPRARVAGRRG